MKDKTMKLNKSITHYLPIIIWMIIIFLFSNQIADDSNAMSSGITAIFYNFLQKFKIDDILSYDMMNHLIRKLAHFTIYFILGVLVIRPFNKPDSFSSFVKAVLICFLYACSDEFHQYFIPGRAMMFTDVLIDTCGSMLGIILYQIYNRIYVSKHI